MEKSITERDILLRILDAQDNLKKEVVENRKDTQALVAQVKIANGRTTTNEKAIKSLGDEHKKVRTIFATLSVLLTGAWGAVTFLFK